MFTDNAVAEGAFFKGTSANKHLFELVLRLKRLEFDHSLKLNVIHVSGRRMVAQGTDGLSRGDLSDGVLQGHPFLDFVPLHESAMTRSSGILPWCLSWLPPSTSLLPLRPKDWYGKGHGILGGTRNPDGLWVPTIANPKTHVFLWAPPPAAADVAVEQLGLSRHKRPTFLHIFICPRLMTHLWRKRLYKLADLVFSIPAGYRTGLWSMNMYEPLTIGILLPFLPIAPWSRRRSPPILEVERKLHEVWKDPQGDERVVLRELWI
jgi:hypothetical protein